MKIVCDFCKTEYNAPTAPTMPVRCAICGHTWTVRNNNNRSPLLVFIGALCALLSAIVFAVVVITHHHVETAQNQTLVARVTGYEVVTDEFGASHFVVSGTVENRSDSIYGVPDLVIILWDDADNIVAQQKFMPSATLLDSGASVAFSHTMSAPTNGVKKITAKLLMDGVAQ